MITRKEFVTTSLAVLGASVVGCGDDTSGTGAGGSGGSGGSAATGCSPEAAIATNHGHTLTISKADVEAGVEKTYDIKGSSPHTHSVTITAPMFEQLGGVNPDVSITVTSSATDHSHSITITCA